MTRRGADISGRGLGLQRARHVFLVAAACLPLLAAPADAQEGAGASIPLAGIWLTGEGDALVQIRACQMAGQASLCGRLIALESVRASDGNLLRDTSNPDTAKQDNPLCGLRMLAGFERKTTREWINGWIYDPQNGRRYQANMALQDDGSLNLRGYVGAPLFGRTETWQPGPADALESPGALPGNLERCPRETLAGAPPVAYTP